MDRYDHELEEIDIAAAQLGVHLGNLRPVDPGEPPPEWEALVNEARELTRRRAEILDLRARLKELDRMTSAQSAPRGRLPTSPDRYRQTIYRAGTLAAILLVIAVAWQVIWVALVAILPLAVALVAWRRWVASTRQPNPITTYTPAHAERDALIAELDESSIPTNPQSSNGKGSRLES